MTRLGPPPTPKLEKKRFGTFYDELANGIISDLFQVKVQEKKPNHAGLAIPYKGYWFYIDETDISSKRTIGVLNSLVRLKIRATGAQNIPVLT